MEVSNIINAIDTICEKIYQSIETEVFTGLDELLIIDENLLKKEPLNTLFTSSDSTGFVILCSSFIVFFLIYYILIRLISMYNGESAESIYKCMLRIILCTICSTMSFYIIKEILNINGLFTGVLTSVGEDLTKGKICFESFRNVVIDLNKYMTNEALSIDGVIKGVISFGSTSLLITFAIRYVTIIFLIIVSPLTIMFASSNATYSIFKSWLKLFLINLLLQNVVIIVLMIPLGLKKTSDEMYKIIMVGSIYMLYRINNFTKDFLGSITDSTIRRK